MSAPATSPPNGSPQQSPSPPSPPSPSPRDPILYEGTPITSPRSLRQLSVFLFGSACLLVSTAITRKAIWRRQLRQTPKYFDANTNPHEYFSPFQDACQALNLATLNCASVGTMALGGAMWTFDIAGLAEARQVLRGRLGYEKIYRSEEDVPNSVSEMIRQSGEMRVREEEEDVEVEQARKLSGEKKQ
ncbi:hypothetical protein NX059_005180 [Plenodomus lindquistii]|nr:hypothetical protein NX059_005180 [Plenodomus lindquistii]